jgi:pyrroloquinoline quinone biosynthesis protein B
MKDTDPASSLTQRGTRHSRRSFMLGVAGSAGALATGALDTLAAENRVTGPTATVEAVLLGSAQDGSVPHAGCRKAHCEAARSDPRLRRRSPCLAVLDHEDNQAFLLDAGPDLPSQLDDLPPAMAHGKNPVSGIFLTHAHIGHYAGLIHLGREVMSTSQVPVYCSRQMAAFLGDNGPWSLLVELGNIALKPIAAGQPVRLSPRLSITPLGVPHRAEYTDTFAFVVSGPSRKLLYLPDIDRWESLEPAIERLVQEVDVSLIDGSFYSAEELPGRDMSKIPHPPISETTARLQKIADRGDRQLVFIHLNHSNLLLDADGKRLAELRARGYERGEEGMRFAL